MEGEAALILSHLTRTPALCILYIPPLFRAWISRARIGRRQKEEAGAGTPAPAGFFPQILRISELVALLVLTLSRELVSGQHPCCHITSAVWLRSHKLKCLPPPKACGLDMALMSYV